MPAFWGLLLAKLTVLFLALVVAWHLNGLRLAGRNFSIQAARGLSGAPSFESLKDEKLSKWICLACNLTLAIFIIEVMVHLRLPSHHYPPLFFVHAPAALSFVALVAVLPIVHGGRSRRFHRIAGRTALALFLLAFVTGGILLYQL